MGGVENGAAEEDWCWDLNPGTAAMLRGTHAALEREGEPHGFGAPFAMQFRKLESKM